MLKPIKGRSLLFSFVFTAAVLAFAAGSGGAACAEDEIPSTTKVTVGVYAVQVPMMSLKDNKFQLDFYIWFRWQGKDVKPYESFELANGKIDSRQLIDKSVKAGENYAILRCTATMVKFWDVISFPFDNHVLELQVEDNVWTEDLLTYVPDSENSTMSPQLAVPGWKVNPSQTAVAPYVYHTNYGDITLPKDAGSTYSRFVFSIPIVREGLMSGVKLFFAMYMAVLIALLSFFIMPNDPGPRLGVATGAIFASVGASFVIANAIPATMSFTIAERINVLTVGTVFLALSLSVFSVRRFKIMNKIDWSLKFDRWASLSLLIVYLVGNIILAR
jgi:hypothetical protein